jgi:glycerophosphoryl diester phosphodiesterase
MHEWLTAHPIAHRGLHDTAAGVIENTASAFQAAITGGYGIECDVQISADGEAMVYHDDTLDRLTEVAGKLAALTAAQLKKVRFKNTDDRMLTLGELCELVAGRAALVIEIKSRFDGDTRLAQRCAEAARGYAGPAALMSFDPDVVAALRSVVRGQPRGLVAQRHKRSSREANHSSALQFAARIAAARPNFIAYRVQDLPAALPLLARHILRLPLLTWTVRTADERQRAAKYADQMIFEGFRP